ncbi:hypothetical protein ABZ468_28415 [Streptomyces sp. NPDC005708]|uniref:hypothetical protein n=1 Tax=Streptomyces sp. NPDC005708 TaxID=3154564 RepID=UPI0033C2ADDB
MTMALDDITEPDELRALRADVSERLAVALNERHGDAIVPGRRVRLVRITPVCMVNLTGIVQADATGKRKTNRYDVLLDESSTQALRQDPRVDNTHRATRPEPGVLRQLVTSVPTKCMILADRDS